VQGIYSIFEEKNMKGILPKLHGKHAFLNHSYDILGAGMLWKPKDLHKIRQNSLKFTLKECYDKVLNEEF
jgi:hypothetical protein